MIKFKQADGSWVWVNWTAISYFVASRQEGKTTVYVNSGAKFEVDHTPDQVESMWQCETTGGYHETT